MGRLSRSGGRPYRSHGVYGCRNSRTTAVNDSMGTVDRPAVAERVEQSSCTVESAISSMRKCLSPAQYKVRVGGEGIGDLTVMATRCVRRNRRTEPKQSFVQRIERASLRHRPGRQVVGEAISMETISPTCWRNNRPARNSGKSAIQQAAGPRRDAVAGRGIGDLTARRSNPWRPARQDARPSGSGRYATQQQITA